MKAKIYSIVVLLLVSCTHKEKSKIENNLIRSPNKNQQFYKCDYSIKDSLITVLASGDDTTTNEVWAINKSDIKNFPEVNFNKIDLNEIIKIGKNHLLERFKPIKLTFSELSIQKIDDKLESKKNWVIILSFKYNERGYYQMVPVLLDRRIILSNNEKSAFAVKLKSQPLAKGVDQKNLKEKTIIQMHSSICRDNFHIYLQALHHLLCLATFSQIL